MQGRQVKRHGLILALLAWSLAAAPQRSPASPIEGTWTLDARKGDPVHLDLHRVWNQRGSHGSWSWSDDFRRGDLRGLPTDKGYRGDATWSLARDAGTVRFEGRLDRGRGSGRFTFEPDASFAADLKRAGYGDASDEDLMRLFAAGLGRTWVQEMASLGLDDPSIEDLLRLLDNDVKPEYIRGLASAGYRGLAVDEVIRLRINDVTPGYLKELGSPPGAHWSVDQAVRFRLNGVEAPYVKVLAPVIDGEGIVRLQQNGVSADDVLGFRALGYESATVDDFVRLRNNDVSPAFARRARDLHGAVTVEELIQLRVNGAE